LLLWVWLVSVDVPYKLNGRMGIPSKTSE